VFQLNFHMRVNTLLRSVVIAIFIGCTSQGYAQTGCQIIPPMATLVLESIYTDAKGSIEDHAAEDRNAAQNKDLRTFMAAVENAIDKSTARPGNPETDCAFKQFDSWARAGALTFEPPSYNREGKISRGLINPGFQMVGVKFRAAGFKLNGQMLSWLKKMNTENVVFYEKGTNRGNQRVWAATGAAIHALLDRDPEALRFQDQVWHEAITAIHENGTIDAELSRGRRAIVYHLYSFGATVMLRSARQALGYPDRAEDVARLKLLGHLIGHSMCDQSEMTHLAGIGQEVPGAWAYRLFTGFTDNDLLGPDWARCLPANVTPFEWGSGGDPRRSAEILSELARRRSQS
jgi:poly(beta-D-mannuronate) lyase